MIYFIIEKCQNQTTVKLHYIIYVKIKSSSVNSTGLFSHELNAY